MRWSDRKTNVLVRCAREAPLLAPAPYRLLVTAAIDVVVGNAHPTSPRDFPGSPLSFFSPSGGDQGGGWGGSNVKAFTNHCICSKYFRNLYEKLDLAGGWEVGE